MVENCFGSSGQPLGIPDRVLVGEGVLTKMCRKRSKPRQFFLFNDILVYGNIVISKKKYNKQHLIPLEEVQLQGLEDNGHWTIPKDDFFLEMLEVLINSIIYVRNIYPESIFKQQRLYNTTCYLCIYPPLRDYIQNVLKTAAALKRKDELYKIDLIFEKDESTILEMFSFGFESAPGQKQLFDDDDQYLIEAEETIRAILLGLDEKCKNLRKLPRSGVNFKIMLHTTQVALVKLTSDPKVKDFPWTQGKDILAESHTILPMAQVSGFQLSAEDFM